MQKGKNAGIKGAIAAIVYLFLISIAYASQIIKNLQTRDVSSLSLSFFFLALIAVTLRASSLGFAIIEIWKKAKIKSISNIALAIAEAIVILSLAIIVLQIFLIR